MAVLTTNVASNMLDPGYFYTVTPGNVLGANSTEIRLRTPEGNVQSYQGHFSYYNNGDLYWSGSTLNAVVEYNPAGAEISRVTGISVPGSTYYNYSVANNFYGLKAYALSGADSIYGSSFSDVLNGFSGNDSLYGNDGNDGLIGEAGSDLLYGGNGNDLLLGGAGDDGIHGGSGLDTAFFSGNRSQYAIDLQPDLYAYVLDNVSGREGRDYLTEIERLDFLDLNVALDTGKGEIAGSAYRLYKAAYDRAPDEVGLGFWIDALDNGVSLLSVAKDFNTSAEFKKLYGSNVTDRDYLTKLYNNVLDRDPDQGGYEFWLNALSNGVSRETLLIDFSESKENIANVAELIANGIEYQEWLG